MQPIYFVWFYYDKLLTLNRENLDMGKIHSILKEYWGFDSFRPLQEDIIMSVIEGHDTLGLMPTGGGKSITFQVPALALSGICIVITPLIALMKDQVDNLKDKGILAEAIYSGKSKNDIARILDNCILGDYKFLYVSPERLATDNFLLKVKQMKVTMIAVDESHCISQWGYDFRPSYLKIADLRLYFPNVPILALTATATPQVVTDIQEKLAFRAGANVFKKSFARYNLAYVVKYTDDKLGMMMNILDKVPGTSVVYVRNREKTKEIADYLKNNGISADFYHAGLSNEAKDLRQNAWKSGQCRVIVATNAFGMGIDKPDVRTVIHIDLPDSLEAYFQEAGRAGRDGEKAYAVLLYSNADGTKLKKRISDTYPEKDFIATVYNSLFNYFQVAENEGLGVTYPFSVVNFCKIFHFNITQTESAIDLIQQAGYIELHEDTDSQSRFVFTVTRDDLYLNKTTDIEDNVMCTIMRCYSGVFCDYVYIDENYIAEHSGLTRELVYQTLVELRQNGLVNYIPLKKEPCITITKGRVDLQYFSIPKQVYEIRKEQYMNKINNVIDYASDTTHCRSRMLLHYFGEDDSKDCCQCDNCINQRKKNISPQKHSSIINLVISAIEANKGPIGANELLNNIKGVEEQPLKQTIRLMLDNGQIIINQYGKIEMKQKS